MSRKGWRKGTSVLDQYRHLLGAMTDTKIAQMAQCSRERVRQVRQLMGIARVKRARKSGVSEQVEVLLGGKVGTMPDLRIARLTGLSQTTVVNYRKSLGIAPYGMKDRKAKLSDEHVALLGRVSDKDMGALTGYSFTTIHRIRTKMGIKMQYDGRRKK